MVKKRNMLRGNLVSDTWTHCKVDIWSWRNFYCQSYENNCLDSGRSVYILCGFYPAIYKEIWFYCKTYYLYVSYNVLWNIVFYNIGLFVDTSYLHQWLLFFAIILCLYFICLVIYGSYRKKKCELYTHALQKYQQERRTINE